MNALKVGLMDVFCLSLSLQVQWRDEVRHHFEKIKSEGTCLHRLDEELIKRRREELRLVGQHQDKLTAERTVEI